MKNINIDVTTDTESLVDSLFAHLSTQETQQFIKDIDLRYADVGFTEELVVDLLQSLKGELGDEQQRSRVDGICREIEGLEYD